MTTLPSISVIIVSYNTGPVLARALDSVLAQTGLHEVILVDNGNPEDVRTRLDNFATTEPMLKILRGQGNVGFARGCNLGVDAAQGDYVLLLNPDCLLSPNALMEVVKAMEQHPNAWLAGCRMVHPDGTLQVGSKRNLLTPTIALNQALWLFRLNAEKFTPLNLQEHEEEREPEIVPAISGAFMMMKREKYEQIDGMDERYFFHVEDLDLCRQINQKGGKVLFVPSVQAVHYRGSSRVTSVFVECNKTDGFIRYFSKYYKQEHPRVFYLVALGIYLRLWLKAPLLWLMERLHKRKRRAHAEMEQRQLRLLKTALLEETVQKTPQTQAPVVLTGATGQVGLNILHRLLAANIETYALYNRRAIDYRHPKLVWIQGDLNTTLPGLADVAPKTLIYTPQIWLLPQHLERFAKMGVTRVICFSSTSISGKSMTKNAYEKDLIRRFVEAEKEVAARCEELGIAWTIFRPTLIYSGGLDRNVNRVVNFIRHFGFFPVYPPACGLRQPVHGDDVAAAVMAAIAEPKTHSHTYNLGGNTTLSYQEMVKKICTVMGLPPRIISVPGLPWMLDIFSWIIRYQEINGEIAKRMNQDLVCDDTPARHDFGYTPREFLAGGLADLGLEKPEEE